MYFFTIINIVSVYRTFTYIESSSIGVSATVFMIVIGKSCQNLYLNLETRQC